MKHNQQRARSGKKSRGSISLLERIQPDAAGIDCGQNSHFVAVPYQSLRIDEAPMKIVLPGASKEALKNLPEFKYHA